MSYVESKRSATDKSGRTQQEFEEIFRSLGSPKEVALFSRMTNGGGEVIYLMTPAAALLSHSLSGECPGWAMSLSSHGSMLWGTRTP
jgi:hypothetical protein